jgi:small subunit ribosomal protein S16
MLVIRFLRTGKKAQPFFKIVVTDKKNPPRGGSFIENLGFINPLTKEKSVKGERVKHWLSVGAQASDSVHNLLVEQKIIEGKKIVVYSKSKKTKEEEKEVKVPKTEEVEKEAPVKETKEDATPEAKEEKTEKKAEVVKEEAPVEEEVTKEVIEEK